MTNLGGHDFPSFFLNGKSNQNKQCQQIPDFIFLKFQTKLFEILKISLSLWESININPIMSPLKIKKKMESDKNLIFPDIVYFGLIYPPEKKRKIQTGENHVHQGLSM